MHCRTSLRNDEIPYLRTSAFADARVVRCKGRNRPRDNGIQHQAHDKHARRNQTDGSTSSCLIGRSDGTYNPNAASINEAFASLYDFPELSFITIS
jgi:hypothetical protein